MAASQRMPMPLLEAAIMAPQQCILRLCMCLHPSRNGPWRLVTQRLHLLRRALVRLHALDERTRRDGVLAELPAERLHDVGGDRERRVHVEPVQGLLDGQLQHVEIGQWHGVSFVSGYSTSGSCFLSSFFSRAATIISACARLSSGVAFDQRALLRARDARLAVVDLGMGPS